MARTFRSRHAGSGTVACFLFLCLFFCVTGSPHSAIQTELFEGVQPSSAKVDVRVYVTAKSSTCRELLTQVVAHVVQKDEMWSAVNLRVVTLGTSHIASSNTTDSGEESAELKCSGGQASACLGDAWVACIQRYYPDSSRYFPVFNCIAGRACVEGEQAPADCFGVPSEVAPVCVREFGEGMEEARIQECAEGARAEEDEAGGGEDEAGGGGGGGGGVGEEGRALLLANMREAKQLTPPLSSLPWITVDGTPVGPALGSEELLGHAVCQRIKARGLPEPRGCAFQPRRPRPLYAGGSYTDEGWRGGGGGGGVDVTSIVEVVLFCLIGASIAHLWCEAPPAERHLGTIHTDDGGDFEGGGYHDGGGYQDNPDRR